MIFTTANIHAMQLVLGISWVFPPTGAGKFRQHDYTFPNLWRREQCFPLYLLNHQKVSKTLGWIHKATGQVLEVQNSMRLLQGLKYTNSFRFLWKICIFISIGWAKVHNEFGKSTEFWQTASNSGEQKAPDVMLKYLFAFLIYFFYFLEDIYVICPSVEMGLKECF